MTGIKLLYKALGLINSSADNSNDKIKPQISKFTIGLPSHFCLIIILIAFFFFWVVCFVVVLRLDLSLSCCPGTAI